MTDDCTKLTSHYFKSGNQTVNMKVQGQNKSNNIQGKETSILIIIKHLYCKY